MYTIEALVFTQEEIDILVESLDIYISEKINSRDYSKIDESGALRYKLLGVKSVEDMKSLKMI